MNILLVDDNKENNLLMQEAFEAASVNCQLNMVEDGAEALAFIRREEPYQRVPQPDLILLDLHLPRKDGREVLSEIKNDKRFRHIPVIMLSTSDEQIDINACYRLLANCYLTKAPTYPELLRLVEAIRDFWLNRVSYFQES